MTEAEKQLVNHKWLSANDMDIIKMRLLSPWSKQNNTLIKEDI